jgi:hypothetical protein
VKQFVENFTPIEIEVKNIKQESFVIKTIFMDSSTVEEVENMMKPKYDKEGKIIEEAANTSLVFKMLEKTFGKGEEFFKQFSFNLLGDIIKYVAEETKKNSQTQSGSTS